MMDLAKTKFHGRLTKSTQLVCLPASSSTPFPFVLCSIMTVNITNYVLLYSIIRLLLVHVHCSFSPGYFQHFKKNGSASRCDLPSNSMRRLTNFKVNSPTDPLHISIIARTLRIHPNDMLL